MSKCEFCDVKLNAMPFVCPKCGKHFCGEHKIPADHECKNLDAPEMVDEGLVKHEAKEKEHSKYIDEEVTIIKRRIAKNKESSFVKFFASLWAYNLIIIVLVLLTVGFFLQTTGKYDFEAKIADMASEFGISIPFFEKEVIVDDENLTKIEEVRPALSAPDMTLITRIQDNPKIYLGKSLEIETFVEWSEKKVNRVEFQYRAVDDEGKFLYFTFFQNIGFNKYSKYKITGVLKKELDTYYIDANDIEKI